MKEYNRNVQLKTGYYWVISSLFKKAKICYYDAEDWSFREYGTSTRDLPMSRGNIKFYKRIIIPKELKKIYEQPKYDN